MMSIAKIIAAVALLSAVSVSAARAEAWVYVPSGDVTVVSPATSVAVPAPAPIPVIVAPVAPQVLVPIAPAPQVIPVAPGGQTLTNDAQRVVSCLINTGGNYVACGANEAMYEVAKCVNGVGIRGGCFAPKMVTAPHPIRHRSFYIY